MDMNLENEKKALIKFHGSFAVECVNGSCPIANAEEYAMYGMDVITSCEDCCYFTGKEGISE